MQEVLAAFCLNHQFNKLEGWIGFDFLPFPETKRNTLPHSVHVETRQHSLSFERLKNEALTFR